jgi:methylmalonyl-CoA carboxyltransferase small subunit
MSAGSDVQEKGSSRLKLQITIDGKAYEVDVELLEDDESPQAPSDSPSSVAHSAGGGHAQGGHAQHGGVWDADEKVCHSPVMGLVIKVDVEPGQDVEAGVLLLVLEAMKMETKVTAPRAGTVKNVHVKPGDPVKVNQLLVEFE